MVGEGGAQVETCDLSPVPTLGGVGRRCSRWSFLEVSGHRGCVQRFVDTKGMPQKSSGVIVGEAGHKSRLATCALCQPQVTGL